MRFRSWFKETRDKSGKTQQEIVEYKRKGKQVVGKSRPWLARFERGDPGAKIPDRSTCIAMGQAMGLPDPDEVWIRARRERLEEFDPDIAAWIDSELQQARAHPDGLPDDIRPLVGRLLQIPTEQRGPINDLLWDLINIGDQVPQEERPEHKEEMDNRTEEQRWSQILNLGDVVRQLTMGFSQDKKLNLLLTIAQAQLEAKKLVLQMGVGHPSWAADALGEDLRAFRGELRSVARKQIREHFGLEEE